MDVVLVPRPSAARAVPPVSRLFTAPGYPTFVCCLACGPRSVPAVHCHSSLRVPTCLGGSPPARGEQPLTLTPLFPHAPVACVLCVVCTAVCVNRPARPRTIA